MRIPYDSESYAYSRLVDTYILYKGEVSKVTDVFTSGKCLYLTLLVGILSPKSDTVMLESYLLDISPLPLGYLNNESGCSYIMRRSARRWKQGLDLMGLIEKGEYTNPDGVGPSFDSNFNRMVKGEYPSLQTAKHMIETGHCAVAFDRDWAITGTRLLFKGRVVGRKGELSSDYEFLKELLEEASK